MDALLIALERFGPEVKIKLCRNDDGTLSFIFPDDTEITLMKDFTWGALIKINLED